MSFTFDVKVAQKVEIENAHGKRDYLVTFVGGWGEVTFRIVQLPKTKIGRLRFPEVITIKLK